MGYGPDVPMRQEPSSDEYLARWRSYFAKPRRRIMDVFDELRADDRPKDAATNLFDDPTAVRGYAYAIRSPADNLGDGISLETGISFDGEEKLVRAELAEQSDINWIVRHYSGGTAFGRQARYDDIDYSLDLQQALAAEQYLEAQHLEAPEELKEKYPDKYAILRGINNGEYEKDLKELEKTQSAARADAEVKANAAPPEPPTNTKPAAKAPE